VLFLILLVILVAFPMVPGRASSHREAPLISLDPAADNTDVYAWVSPASNDRVTFVTNFIPLQFPSAGPNFFRFDPNVLYEVHIDNNGDASEDITYQFRFRTEIRNPATFLYNTGVVSSLDDLDLNVRQFYSVTRVDGRRRTGVETHIGSGPVMPANVGTNSMPNYDAIGSGVTVMPDGTRVFAGPRDEGFIVDLGGTFDLLQLRNLTGVGGPAVSSTHGFNVHTIAFDVPIARLTRSGSRPTDPNDANAIIGVWSTASRRAVTTRTPGGETTSGDWVQVSRLGNPLVNEAVIPVSTKDAFNSLEPTSDGAALSFVTNPIVPPLLTALFGVDVPPTPRNDLVTIFLTGIPGLNQPPNGVPCEQLRLNVAIPPATASTYSPFGLLGGDVAGYPNGRRPGDDVLDIALRALAGGTPLTPAFNKSPNNILGDGVTANDKPFLDTFPYLAAPHPGLDRFGPQVGNR
jgi:hypothetical protein